MTPERLAELLERHHDGQDDVLELLLDCLSNGVNPLEQAGLGRSIWIADIKRYQADHDGLLTEVQRLTDELARKPRCGRTDEGAFGGTLGPCMLEHGHGGMHQESNPPEWPLHPGARWSASSDDDATRDTTPCPHCPDGHDNPNTKPWAVWVSATRLDGQPPYLHVAPAGGSHVSESDAAWLRQAIRTTKRAAVPDGAGNAHDTATGTTP